MDGNPDLTFAEYQEHVNRTNPGDRSDFCLSILSMGLCGESGEFIDMVKKVLGHGHDMDLDKAIGELGDVFWYLTALCDWFGFTLQEVAEWNVRKLQERYPNGFNNHDSINRREQREG